MRGKLQSSRPGVHRWMPKAVLLLVLTLSASGCNLLRSALELPERGIRSLLSLDNDNDAPDPVELQSRLLRFANNAIEVLNLASGKLQHEDDQPSRKRAILVNRIATTNDILAIATGDNAYVNLLDMVIFASLNRMNVEDYLIPKLYGESARPYLHASQEVEKEIWRIAATILEDEQLSELRDAILAWHEQHPDARTPHDLGSLGYASEIAQMKRDPQPGITSSVFNLLVIDPFADLDPATRELADTRLFAERGMFLARHMPTLIRWETELLIIQTAEMPQTEKLLANTSQLSESADRFSRTTERLPDFISAERRQILLALDEQQPRLMSLAAQTEKTLDSGQRMSDASNAALESFQDVLQQLRAWPSNPNKEPFRISDYTAAAAQINATAQELTRLLQTFEQTLSPSKELVDYTLRRALFFGLMLIGSACLIVLASAVVFWRLKKKFA